MDGLLVTAYISLMKNQSSWLRKVFDEPRVGFVAEHGSQLHPLEKRREPAARSPKPSPLDKIIDEERQGFALTQRTESTPREAVAAKLRRPQSP